MTKMIVKTTGPFQLVDFHSDSHARPELPSVVVANTFFQHRVSLGQVKVLATDLPDEAISAEFDEVLEAAGGDLELAVESYRAELAARLAPPPLSKKEAKAKAKAEAKAAADAAQAAPPAPPAPPAGDGAA
jgi:hypothetical protein